MFSSDSLEKLEIDFCENPTKMVPSEISSKMIDSNAKGNYRGSQYHLHAKHNQGTSCIHENIEE